MTELANTNPTEQAIVNPDTMKNLQQNDAAFAGLSTSGFLARLQLMGSSSKQCKQGLFPIGEWAMVSGQTFTQIGKEVDCLIITWRPKALDTAAGDKHDEVLNCYDFKSAEFQDIATRAQIKDSGCMAGPEYLLWVPKLNAFLTYFMSNKSGQQEAPNVKNRIGKDATLKITFVPSKKYGGWHAPICVDCATPLPRPLQAVLDIEIKKFLNPPAMETEVATPTDTATAGTDRPR